MNKGVKLFENNKEIEMEILFTFEDKGKQYVLYFDLADSSEDTEVFASIYDKDGNLYPVEDDKEWDLIDEVLQQFINEQEDDSPKSLH